MTEQPYRVIADRSRGDEMAFAMEPEPGDRLTYMYETVDFGMHGLTLVRIERPVPPADEFCTGGDDCSAAKHVHGCFADRGACSASDEHILAPEPLTRAQIAEAILPVMASDWDQTEAPSPYRIADAVLSLIKNGASR